MLYTILNIHGATMLHVILLHGKFTLHDATLLHATKLHRVWWALKYLTILLSI